MDLTIVFVVLCCTVVQGTQVLREKLFEYQQGWLGAPNWEGPLYCPMDYGINIKSIKIVKPCPGFHCSKTVNYKPRKKDDIYEQCNTKNYCNIKIWQKSYTDGNEIIINYSCESLLELDLFKNKLVERFYNTPDVSVVRYCTQSRRKRQGGSDIPADWTRYSIDEAIEARRLMAEARVRGYEIVEHQPSSLNVFRTTIRRTRRLPNGGVVTVPVYIAANLTLWTMQPSSQRGPFPPYVNDYLNQCGIRRGNNPDDGGHLVAYTLGGSDTPTNLVPMARDLNRRQGIWYRHEEEVRNFLRAHSHGLVTWEVIVHYSISSQEPYRPVAFTLRYTTYEDGSNLRNGAVRIECFINENEDYQNNQCTFNYSDFFRPPQQQDPSDD